MADSKVSNAQKHVIVIGAGVGGLATAARLAKSGVSVTLIEKTLILVGDAVSSRGEGFGSIAGQASFYLMPEIFEALFEDLGEVVRDWYELRKCEPNYVLHYDDHETVTLSTDMERMKAEIEKWEGKDGWARFLAFMTEGREHYETSVKEVLTQNFPNLLSLLRPRYLLMAIRLHVFDFLHRRARNYFWTDRMQRAFTFSSMYLGMSPYRAPATYSLLQYTELAQGIWYPVGGFHALPRSLAQIAAKYGANIRLGTNVRRIVLDKDGRRAVGVELEDGEVVEADAVVCNADLVWAYTNLLPPSSYSTSLAKSASLTCSSISFYWGLKRHLPSLSTHQIYLAADYKPSFDKIFDEKTIPDEPSFYVNIPSNVDPSAAPKGKDAVVVLVPVGHLLEPGGEPTTVNGRKQDWPSRIAHARAHVLSTLTSHLPADALNPGETLEDLIEVEEINTPLTWETELNLFKGSILGLSHGILQVLAFRPRTRHAKYRGLHFVGASTHPGTGVPVVACGSKITAEQVLSDFNIQPPWRQPRDGAMTTGKGKRTKEMDVLKKPGSLVWEEWVVWLFGPATVVLVLALVVRRLGIF